jgi:hypothetical protein
MERANINIYTIKEAVCLSAAVIAHQEIEIQA